MVLWLSSLVVLAASSPDIDPVQQAVTRLVPNTTNEVEIRPSPIPRLKEVTIGTQVFYVTEDGQFLLAGPLIALELNQNLTEVRASEARKQLVGATSLPNKVLFQNQSTEHHVTVVTNVDCGYCRAMHARLQEYYDLGIGFEYVMTPAGGRESPGYHKTAALLCASDPPAAITRAMAGTPEAGDGNCSHYLDQHVALARSLGANTTPNLILPDGRLIRGFTTPEDLLLALQAPP